MVQNTISATIDEMRPTRQAASRFLPFLCARQEKRIPSAASGSGRKTVAKDNSAKMPKNIEAVENALFLGLVWYSIRKNLLSKSYK